MDYIRIPLGLQIRNIRIVFNIIFSLLFIIDVLRINISIG